MRLVEGTRQASAAGAAAGCADETPSGGDRVGHLARALRLAAGPGCWPLVEHMFRDLCGPTHGVVAARLFRVLLQGLALGARRPLRLGFVGAPALSHDERAVLQMIAAAREGHTDLVEASVRWLVRPALSGPVARVAASLAELLSGDDASASGDRAGYARQRPLSGPIAAAES